jgi:hypothetical protein
MSDGTNKKFTKILFDLREVYNDSNTAKIETAIFRYSSQYKGTEYSSNSELPVDKAIKEYKKYLEWKGGIWR